MASSNVINFVVDKTEEQTTIVSQNAVYTQYVSQTSVYADATKSVVIGYLNIDKKIYGLDANLNVVPGVTNAIYNYYVNWTPNTGVPGISSFVIVPEDQVLNGGSTEVPGTYYGAIDGTSSSGNFRNYGGSARKVKDSSSLRQYTLKYVPVTVDNVLP